jgi:fumarylacetoacetate (FAA) hydrolase family protein
MNTLLAVEACLPADRERATLVGRMWRPDASGPALVVAIGDALHDLSSIAPTASALMELPDPARAVRAATALPKLAALSDVLANSAADRQDTGKPYLLAPCDLQAIKASGVTFVSSMLERVIEEHTRGDPAKAESVRRSLVAAIGDDLAKVRPGSPEAKRVKEALVKAGAWSQYLEVGIGPDAEIFTKAQPMSAVGLGADIGIHPKSEWNTPEPEIVLVVNSRGETLGATLGNDVNLRDFEGRSAIGPFIRLFDGGFGIDDVRRCELAMKVEGPEGFTLDGSSSMAMISRDPLDLVSHAIGPNHQYPDGLVLFLGTMFAPTKDRFGPGQGFTHAVGDVVTIATPKLGALVNRVDHSDKIRPWTFGAGALMANLARRGLV